MGKLVDYARIIEQRINDSNMKVKALALTCLAVKKSITVLKVVDDKLSKRGK